MPRDAKADKDTCYKSENANELARIGLYYIELCTAYRELADALTTLARYPNIIFMEPGYKLRQTAAIERVDAARAKIREIEEGGK